MLSTKSKLAPFRSFWGPYSTASYAYMGGTSMAAPLVSGCAALVREYYVANEGWDQPSAALVKATLINGTQMLTGRSAIAEHADLPNFHQGFGCVDMVRTIPNSAENFDLCFIDSWNDPSQHMVRTGQRFRYEFDLPNTDWLRICLAYTDAPGRSIQNDLNITLQYLPVADPPQKWTGNQGAVANQLLKTPDRKNNVERSDFLRLFQVAIFYR
ncbi:S8 family serine peptidase [Dyadobacter sp. CY326]|nr:S8 family serine peptidase [Dyadobacter sp. CY326]